MSLSLVCLWILGPSWCSDCPSLGAQSLQQSFLRCVYCVNSSHPVEVIFQKLFVTWWHNFRWRRVLGVWCVS